MRGPNVMPGYLNKPEETAKALRNGWYHTGDLAKADANNFLTITGRLKELIIRGGQNIAPAEIEEVVNTFAPVLDCAVVGAPHEHLGEVPVLFVVRARRADGRERGAARALPREALGLQGAERGARHQGDPAHRLGQDHPVQAEGVADASVRRVGKGASPRVTGMRQCTSRHAPCGGHVATHRFAHPDDRAR